MRKTYLGALVICICLVLSACGQSASQTQVDTNAEQSAGEAQTISEDKDIETVAETSAKEKMLEKYSNVIDFLEKEDYDNAIAEIEKMKKDSKSAKYGDVADYLVSFELTADNFDEFFEFAAIQGKNAFGEDEDTIWFGLKSKKYDEDLVFYGITDREYNDNITIEYTYNSDGDASTDECALNDLLSFSRGIGGDNINVDSFSIKPTGRIAGSKITFIKKEFIESYDIEPVLDQSHTNTQATVTLKNGDIYYLNVNPDHLY